MSVWHVVNFTAIGEQTQLDRLEAALQRGEKPYFDHAVVSWRDAGFIKVTADRWDDLDAGLNNMIGDFPKLAFYGFVPGFYEFHPGENPWVRNFAAIHGVMVDSTPSITSNPTPTLTIPRLRNGASRSGAPKAGVAKLS